MAVIIYIAYAFEYISADLEKILNTNFSATMKAFLKIFISVLCNNAQVIGIVYDFSPIVGASNLYRSIYVCICPMHSNSDLPIWKKLFTYLL